MPSKKWVLVVDDDPVMLMFLTELLEGAGLKVTSATDAMQAVIQAETLRPYLILMDMQMPGYGSGADAIRDIRKREPLKDVPVLVITGMDLPKAKALLPPDPRVWIMAKPPQRAVLLRILNELSQL